MDMRCKKKCPDCEKVVGARTLQCECGYEWGKRKTPLPKKIDQSKGTIGRKECPKCKFINGLRQRKCTNCNEKFVPKVKFGGWTECFKNDSLILQDCPKNSS